jgi:peptidoglycan-associated lipoprotein
MVMSRTCLVAVCIVALAAGGSTACASKKFVRTSVGEVNDKVDSLGRSVEETQERTRKNEERISEVDQKAQAAAQQANEAALAAHNAATYATAEAFAVDIKFDALDKANRRLVYQVVLNVDSGNFEFGKTALRDADKKRIDQMVSELQVDPKNVYIEIEGYTDNIGDQAINERVGLERAQAVQGYLHERYQIPLHKMNVISYGENKPIAPNETPAGRAQNRRVVIKVLL